MFPRIPSIMCVFMIVRVCGIVLDTSICHSHPTAARIAPRHYWQQSICSGGEAKCEDGKYAEGKEKRFVFARAPAAASHFLSSEKRREHVQCPSLRDADTRFVCRANDPRRGGVFRTGYNSHIAIPWKYGVSPQYTISANNWKQNCRYANSFSPPCRGTRMG